VVDELFHAARLASGKQFRHNVWLLPTAVRANSNPPILKSVLFPTRSRHLTLRSDFCFRMPLPTIQIITLSSGEGENRERESLHDETNVTLRPQYCTELRASHQKESRRAEDFDASCHTFQFSKSGLTPTPEMDVSEITTVSQSFISDWIDYYSHSIPATARRIARFKDRSLAMKDDNAGCPEMRR